MTEATLLIRGARILAGAALQGHAPGRHPDPRQTPSSPSARCRRSRPGSVDREIDGKGLLAAPGLINAHMHSQSGTMSGFADGLSHPAFMWLTQAHTSRRTPDEIRLAVLLCAAQMLTTGTTALIDHFPGQRFSTTDMDAVLAAWEETGLRATLAMRFFDGVFSDIIPAGIEVPASVTALVSGSGLLAPHPLAELREQMPDLVTRWHGSSGRIRALPGALQPGPLQRRGAGLLRRAGAAPRPSHPHPSAGDEGPGSDRARALWREHARPSRAPRHPLRPLVLRPCDLARRGRHRPDGAAPGHRRP